MVDDEFKSNVLKAYNTGKYQIVCRNISAQLNDWYITLVKPEDWEWSVNEYRVFVGIDEPPMRNQMNIYSVYFCGYNYYFLDTDSEQTLRKVTNVNFTQYGAQYTTFLRTHEIQSDVITANETGTVEISDNTHVKKDLTVDGTVEIGDCTLSYDSTNKCLRFKFN